MNCILTPHISGITHQSNIRVSDFIVDKVIDFLINDINWRGSSVG